MSRYCGEKNSKPILEAAEYWREIGLLNDGSIFSDKSIWKMENLKVMETYFINRLDEGEGNFLEKLFKQLQPTGPEVKQLAAELLWIMLLCPSNIKESTKIENIKTVWSWSDETFPEDSKWLMDAILKGIGSAGTAYNTSRWRELVFFIRLMMAFKALSQIERNNLLDDGWVFAEWLEQIPECDKRQWRHIEFFIGNSSILFNHLGGDFENR